MASFTLKVTPEVLEQKADEFWSTINKIDRHFQQIGELSERTRGYWRGEAGDVDRGGYDAFKEDIADILHRLDEHPSDLLRMAGIYKQAERENRIISEQLKTDTIV